MCDSQCGPALAWAVGLELRAAGPELKVAGGAVLGSGCDQSLTWAAGPGVAEREDLKV